MPAQMEQRKPRHGSKKMESLIYQYKLVHKDEGSVVTPELVAEWAIEQRLWLAPDVTPAEQLRRLISRSLRESYIIDPQQREVRANLPIIEEVQTPEGPKRRARWYPLFDAPANVARASFALRRRAALADSAQTAFDFMSWNENNIYGDKLEPLDWDFTPDIEELMQPTSYLEGPLDDPLGEDDSEEEDDL
jgi:hypothetical protein